MAWATVLMLVSLIGIPPLIGFFGKLNLFVAAVQADLAGWVVLAVLMSVVSAAYYLRIVRAMFFAETAGEKEPATVVGSAAIGAATLLALALGLAAGPLLAALGTPLP